MEEQQKQEESSGKKYKIIFPAVIGGLVLLAVVGLFTLQVSNPSQNPAPQPKPVATLTATAKPSFKDGSYEAVGNYVSPGGPREIKVTLVLKDNIVTDSNFEGLATDPNSKRFQGEFADGYKAQVIGKPIAEVFLTKVSGSSLTPKGFNDAVEKIKSEAKA